MANTTTTEATRQRTIAAGLVGILLAGSAFGAAFAGGSTAGYGGGGKNDGDDDFDGEDIAIIAGTGAAAAFGLYTLAKKDNDNNDEASNGKAIVAKSARLVPSVSGLVAPGQNVSYRLQVRDAKGAWNDVTASAATTISAQGATAIDGTKNTFVLPVTAGNTGSVPVTAEYAPAGQAPIRATTTLSLAQ